MEPRTGPISIMGGNYQRKLCTRILLMHTDPSYAHGSFLWRVKLARGIGAGWGRLLIFRIKEFKSWVARRSHSAHQLFPMSFMWPGFSHGQARAVWLAQASGLRAEGMYGTSQPKCLKARMPLPTLSGLLFGSGYFFFFFSVWDHRTK